MTLGKKIYALRMKCNMTQEQLAEQLGVSRQSISKYEYGQSTPELEKIKQLAKIFGVTTEELINDEIDLMQNIDTEENSYNDEEEIINNTLETDSDMSEIKVRLDRLEGRVGSLENKCEKISNNMKMIYALVFAASVILVSLVIYLNVSLSARLKKVENNKDSRIEVSSDAEIDIEDKRFSELDFEVKNYDSDTGTVEYHVSCRPQKYDDTTSISAVLTFKLGIPEKIITIPLFEENDTGLFKGFTKIPLTKGYFDLSMVIDTDGEKESIEVEEYPSLFGGAGWNPIAEISCYATEKGKDGSTDLNGILCIYTSTGKKADNEILSCLNYVKVAFLDGDRELYGYTLTTQDMSNIKTYREAIVSYQFDIGNECFNEGDGPVLYLEYDNPYINKRICMTSDRLTDDLLGVQSRSLFFEPENIRVEEIPE